MISTVFKKRILCNSNIINYLLKFEFYEHDPTYIIFNTTTENLDVIEKQKKDNQRVLYFRINFSLNQYYQYFRNTKLPLPTHDDIHCGVILAYQGIITH